MSVCVCVIVYVFDYICGSMRAYENVCVSVHVCMHVYFCVSVHVLPSRLGL